MRVAGVPAELVVRLLRDEAGGARRNDKGGDLGPTVVASSGPGGDCHKGRDRRTGVGDELLVAVDHPFAVNEVCLCPRGAGVGTGTRLGQPEASKACAGDEIGKPGSLLVVRAVGQERVDPQTDGGLEGDAHRLVHPADLLDRHAQAREVAVLACTAVLLRGGESEETELAHLLHRLHREVVLPVPPRGVRRYLGLGELADALSEVLVLGGKLEPHALPFKRAPPARTSKSRA